MSILRNTHLREQKPLDAITLNVMIIAERICSCAQAEKVHFVLSETLCVAAAHRNTINAFNTDHTLAEMMCDAVTPKNMIYDP